jgi:ERF superfamily protein
MPRTSESFAALATALAKAQAELINPEKTSTATLRTGRAGEPDRPFRYAPLASGLNIVRKTLGKHEIAMVQTTAIDAATNMVHLTTTLAHSSGEWIASDWPVCGTAETSNPQRMGEALTYARRHSLFTLVGIAGEDDLDAPAALQSSVGGPTAANAGWIPNAAASARGTTLATGSRAVPKNGRRPPPLPPHPPQESARLREGMLAEIKSLSSVNAPGWAKTMLAVKNRLTLEDARMIEAAFEKHLGAIVSDHEPKLGFAAGVESDKSAGGSVPNGLSGTLTSIQEAAVPAGRASPKTVRHRNKEHLRFVGRQPCLICGRQPSDAHHLRFAQPQALGRKVSDEFAVPLCRTHHREAHRLGQELEWWQRQNVAPLAAAQVLWKLSQSGRTERKPVVLA